MSTPNGESNKLIKIELERLLRIARAARDEVITNRLQLEERELQYGDGRVREAILACANEEFVLSGAISKLWRQLHST